MREIKIDRERDEARKAQASPDAAAPQFDAILAGRVLGGEMIACALRGTRQRRGREGIALAQGPQRIERLATLRLVLLVVPAGAFVVRASVLPGRLRHPCNIGRPSASRHVSPG